MSKQRILDYTFSNDDNYFNFYVNKTNQAAYNGTIKDDNKYIFLHGPKKSGKSFLGKIWLEINKGIKFNNNFDKIISSNKSILIEDIITHKEDEIFHLINYCSLNKLKILITSNIIINELGFIKKDVISRLKTFDFFSIQLPDDDMLLNILTKLFIEKQFVINSNDIFEYIIRRTNRSYEEIINMVNKLDKLSLEKKRQLTIPLIKEIL